MLGRFLFSFNVRSVSNYKYLFRASVQYLKIFYPLASDIVSVMIDSHTLHAHFFSFRPKILSLPDVFIVRYQFVIIERFSRQRWTLSTRFLSMEIS